MKKVYLSLFLVILLTLPLQAATWNRDRTPDPNKAINGIHISSDVVTGYAMGEEGKVYKTTDSGKTWTATTILEVTSFSSVTTLPGDSNTVFVAGNYIVGVVAPVRYGRIWKSEDGGSSFSNILSTTACDDFYDIDFASANVGYAVGKKEATNGTLPNVYRSEDGGQTWANISGMQNKTFYGVKTIDENTIYICGEEYIQKGVYASGSWTWTTIISDGGITYYGIDFASSSIGYYCGTSGVIGKIEEDTATNLTSGTTNTLYAISSSDENNFVAAGDGGVVLTSSDGENISSYTSATTDTLYASAMPNSSNFYYAGGTAGVTGTVTKKCEDPGIQNLNTVTYDLNYAAIGTSLQFKLTGNNLIEGATFISNNPAVTINDVTFNSADLSYTATLNIGGDASAGEILQAIQFINIDGDESITASVVYAPLTINAQPKLGIAAGAFSLPYGMSSPLTITIPATDLFDATPYGGSLPRITSPYSRIHFGTPTLTPTGLTVTVTIDDDAEPGSRDMIIEDDGGGSDTIVGAIIIEDEASSAGPGFLNIKINDKDFGAIYDGRDVISSSLSSFSGKISSPDGVDASSIKLYIDNVEVTASALKSISFDSSTDTFNYALSDTLSEGNHIIKIEAADDFGNTGNYQAKVSVYSRPQLLPGTSILSIPSPVASGNTVTITYTLATDVPEVDIFIASPVGSIVTHKKFNTLSAAGIKQGYGAGYNEIEVELPSDLGNGIYPFRVTYGNKVLGTGYIVVSQ